MRRLGDYIAKLYPEVLDTIITELDTYTNEQYMYNHGLPTDNKSMENFKKQIIIRALNKAQL